MPTISFTQAEMALAADALRAEARTRQDEATSNPSWSVPEHNRRLLLAEARLLLSIADRLGQRANEPIPGPSKMHSQLSKY